MKGLTGTKTPRLLPCINDPPEKAMEGKGKGLFIFFRDMAPNPNPPNWLSIRTRFCHVKGKGSRKVREGRIKYVS